MHLLAVGASGSCRLISGHKDDGQEAKTKVIFSELQNRNSHRAWHGTPSHPLPGPTLARSCPDPHKAEASRPLPGPGLEHVPEGTDLERHSLLALFGGLPRSIHGKL